jgi:enoyl-CoA hydratase/carnithine racemase
MTYAGLSLSFEGAIARIDIGAPAGPRDVLSSLLRACDDLAARDDMCAAILVLPDGCLAGGDAEPQLAAAARALELLPQPVIACIDGAIAGAALEIALACDVRVAGAGATFAMAQVAGGGMPSGGGTQRLPRVAGRSKASEMILLGATLDAEDALACGLVNAVAADGGAVAEATQLAERIATQGPLAVRYAKEAVLRGLEMPLEQALRYETDLTVILQTTHDRDEGVRAFLEKRAPRFEGR